MILISRSASHVMDKGAPAAADVVVVGGGVMGASAAFHLAEAGVDVVLVERGDLAGVDL